MMKLLSRINSSLRKAIYPELRPLPAAEPIPVSQTQNLALSIQQPHLEKILRGIKNIEYRNTPVRIRGRVYLYASKTPGRSSAFEELELTPQELPTGMILGTVEIVGCDGKDGDFQWLLAHPLRLTEPRKPEHRPNPVWFIPFDPLKS